MYSIDFEYDGQRLSDYGFIICKFNPSNGVEIIDSGSKITFNKIAMNNGKRFGLTSAIYKECIQFTFDICKNPDLYDYEEREISDNEYKDIMRWLNRREFIKFKFIDEYKRDCYYNGSFNVERIQIAEKTYGLHLILETDKPFGYGETENITLRFENDTTTNIIEDVSDEIGYIYPSLSIVCGIDGDLYLYNKSINCTMLIKNCSAGEQITIDGDILAIFSSNDSHDICNDFNYEFFKIGNTLDSRENIINASMPCIVDVKYSPIIK